MPEKVTKHTFTVEVEVPKDFIDYLVADVDIFYTNRSGYWAYGVERVAVGEVQDPPAGWLVYESVDGRPTDGQTIDAQGRDATGGALPDGWHLLDRAAALRAWEAGVRRWGVDWYEDTDAEREDVVVQLALLGEVRYG